MGGVAALAPDITEFLDALRRFPGGGKLLRPLFCYWGWRGAGGDAHDERIIDAALSVEILHASALVHDDVMDSSDQRRGSPSAHRKFEQAHVARGWRGAPDRFGLAAAILLGDLLLVWSDEALRKSGFDQSDVARAFAIFETLRTEVLLGQYLDLANQASGSHSIADAMRVVRLKSARYTIERPLQLGGALANAAPDLMAVYAAYGAPLGEAFQLRDDLLGIFGDPAATGKPAGDDIREGKRTVLLALAYESAGAPERAVLEASVGDPELDVDGVARVRAVIEATGARQRVEDLVAKRVQDALRSLQPLAEPTQGALMELAYEATRRRS